MVQIKLAQCLLNVGEANPSGPKCLWYFLRGGEISDETEVAILKILIFPAQCHLTRNKDLICCVGFNRRYLGPCIRRKKCHKQEECYFNGMLTH